MVKWVDLTNLRSVLEKLRRKRSSDGGCQIFGEMTFGARTFGDFWSQTFGDLTIGEHKQ